MNTYKSQNKILSFSFFILASLLISSCTVYQTVPNDGIYSPERRETRVIVKNSQEYRDYEKNYFTRELERIESLEERDVFTDIDSYSSYNDTLPYETSTVDRLNYNPNSAWGYNDGSDVVINVNTFDPYWLNYPGNGWGLNYPYFFNNGFWGPNYWGWNNFYGPSWGFGIRGWGINGLGLVPGWGFGWNNFYGYGGWYGNNFWRGNNRYNNFRNVRYGRRTAYNNRGRVSSYRRPATVRNSRTYSRFRSNTNTRFTNRNTRTNARRNSTINRNSRNNYIRRNTSTRRNSNYNRSSSRTSSRGRGSSSRGRSSGGRGRRGN